MLSKKKPHMSNTPDLSRVVFTSMWIKSDYDRNPEWAQGAWSVVPEVRGSQERGGLKMLANGLDQVRWRQFVLASVDRTLWRSVRERQRKYLSAMTRNKHATHLTFVVLWAMRWNKRATDPMESGCLPTCISTLSATLQFAVYLLSLSRTDFWWVWLFMAFVHRTQFGCIRQPSPDDFCPDLYDDTR